MNGSLQIRILHGECLGLWIPSARKSGIPSPRNPHQFSAPLPFRKAPHRAAQERGHPLGAQGRAPREDVDLVEHHHGPPVPERVTEDRELPLPRPLGGPQALHLVQDVLDDREQGEALAAVDVHGLGAGALHLCVEQVRHAERLSHARGGEHPRVDRTCLCQLPGVAGPELGEPALPEQGRMEGLEQGVSIRDEMRTVGARHV